MPESATLERLRHLAGGPLHRAAPPAADAWRRAGLARGQYHEIHAAEPDDAGAAAGATLALALAAGALPVLWLRTEEAERRGGRLSAAGAVELGLDPDRLLLGIVCDTLALLRAGGDAARCAGLGTVLIEAWGAVPALDLTATRRLALAAETSGVTVVALRVAAAAVPSAAATRWSVAALPSAPLAADAPGAPAFLVECLRRRGGPAGGRWPVEWNRETRVFDDRPARVPAPPLSRAGLPLAVDRAVARDAPAPVRRAG